MTSIPPTRGRDEPSTRPPSRLFAWDKGDLVIVDEVQRGKYRRPALSPSTAKAMEGCPARWAAEKALPQADDPFGAAEIGTSAHSVMEDLFDTDLVAPADRTPLKAMSILLAHSKQMWPGRDEETFAKRGLWISAVDDAYKGLFEIEDPTQVVVRDRELGFGMPGGQEVEVNEVPFTGFIDRVDHTPDGARSIDYKSSKSRPRLKFGDAHGDQLRIYHEVLRVVDGKEPASAHVYYTRLGSARPVPTSKSAMRKTLNAFKRSWVALNKHIDRGAFPTSATPLCGWCPLVNACPAAAANGFTAQVDHAPVEADLGIPVLRTYEAGDLHAIAEQRAKTPKTPSMDLDFGSAMNGDPVSDEPPADAPDAPSKVTPVDTIDSGYRPPTDPPIEERPDVVREPDSAAHLMSEAPGRPGDPSDKDTTMSDLLVEDKPYIELSNGDLNPTSYAAIAVCATATWAYEEIHKAGLKPTGPLIDGLTQTMAHIVAAGQAGLTGSTSFQEGANTRFRGALRTFIEFHPIPFDGDKAAWDEWVALAIKHTNSIVRAGVRLYGADLRGEPWAGLAVGQDDAESA